MISAGELRFEAVVYRESGYDSLGKRDGEYDNTGETFRCSLKDVGASEIIYGDSVGVSRTYEVKARWDAIVAAGLVETDRILVNGHMLRISGIKNGGERDRLAIIDCEEIR